MPRALAAAQYCGDRIRLQEPNGPLRRPNMWTGHRPNTNRNISRSWSNHRVLKDMFDQLSTYRNRVPLDDDELQQAIIDRLEDDPAYHSGRQLRISVEVDDGEVTVRGSVRTPLERRKVDIIARALGASTVKNEIVIEDQAEPRRTSRRAR
jgi:hypothetical protein